MLNISLVGDRELIQKLNAMPDKVQAALRRKVTQLAIQLEAKVKGDKLSGQVLKVQTGALRASIANEVQSSGTGVTGRVFSSGDVKYAGIHEFGGTIHHPGGTPYIVTKDGAQFISKAAAANMKTPPPVTKPRDIHMPERSFMRSSLADMKQQIIDGMAAAVREGLVK